MDRTPDHEAHPHPCLYASMDPETHEWRYSWWDDADDMREGRPATRRKECWPLGALLASILADYARALATYELPSEEYHDF